jgi:phospholipid transport system substrate-binding protein
MLNGKTARALRLGLISSLSILGLLGALSGLGAGSARAESASAYMQRVANDLLAASRTGSASSFAAAVRSHADVPSIGLTALGSYAGVLPKSERPTYFNGMINFISRYAAQEAPKYPVAKAIVIGQTDETAGGIAVDSQVVLKSGESYDVRWILVRRGSGFKVRDAEVLGFRMTSFLDKLFQDYIDQNGGNPRVLVMALNR